MNNILVIESKPILLDLDSFEVGRSMIKEYLIRDTYSFPATRVDHGQYRIIIESPIIRDDTDFSHHLQSIKEIARRLTVLSKCILGEALNTSPWETDIFTKRIEPIDQMPLGWKSNYELVKKEIDNTKRISVHIEVIPSHYCIRNSSPFNDYLSALRRSLVLRQLKEIFSKF